MVRAVAVLDYAFPAPGQFRLVDSLRTSVEGLRGSLSLSESIHPLSRGPSGLSRFLRITRDHCTAWNCPSSDVAKDVAGSRVLGCGGRGTSTCRGGRWGEYRPDHQSFSVVRFAKDEGHQLRFLFSHFHLTVLSSKLQENENSKRRGDVLRTGA